MKDEKFRKKEEVRFNWIVGIFYDIRILFLMIIGYVGEFEESSSFLNRE